MRKKLFTSGGGAGVCVGSDGGGVGSDSSIVTFFAVV